MDGPLKHFIRFEIVRNFEKNILYLFNFQVKVAMINAFLLAWLTHLTTKILADLHSNLYGPDAVMEIFEATPR